MNRLVSFALFLVLLNTVQGEMCQCAGYFIEDDKKTPMDFIAAMDFDLKNIKCEAGGEPMCQSFCYEFMSQITNGGDLFHIRPGAEKCYGDQICELIDRDLLKGLWVGAFSRACGGEYIFTGLVSDDTLCCKNRKHVHCP
ncbi:uncharacterized protein LOC106460302 [Limulus polyphemus]|uniref:Uncharacterized protein LOC106460302 n=1 Tax=Limulus polyphemus TaxID=6850 RepID=A0ABM1B5W4_LIMPO|nr:uncharacterized protein LOC106460302 [Limulus polyphemus]